MAVCAGVLIAWLASAPPLRAATATWATSDLDSWIYNMASQPGSSTAAPTWLNIVTINSSTQQFDPMSSSNPARLGTAFFAFNSSGKITPGLAPSRYQINSVTFTASCQFAGDISALYENQPVSQSQILEEVASNNMTWQKPVELYGAGFRGGYTGLEFSPAPPGPPLFDELVHGYSGSGGSYVVYPVVGSESQPGAYIDVMNSVTGGFSATEPGNTTAPFTPTPWAIGTTNLTRGAPLPTISTFTFDLDLNEPGVVRYLQESLATGGVGFVLSSLHATTDFGGSGVYPRWYTKESAAFPISAPPELMPQLVIDFEILPAGVAGDYNGNGVVDAADYVVWRNGGPLQNEVADLGVVTTQDFGEWRARFGNTAATSASLVGGSAVIPEPATIALMLFGAAAITGAMRTQRI